MAQTKSLDEKIAQCRPFLKWAGGKSKLLPELISLVPKQYGRYFEPFLGGGALFFTIQPKKAVLSDLNKDLIETFRVVQKNVDELIDDLKKHKHTKN